MQTINLMGLSAYLNDHSVGSIAAVELIDEFLKRPESADEKGFFTRLRAEITEDQQVVRGLIARFGFGESVLRKTAAMIAEKVGSLKLTWDDPDGQGLRRLEALALGVHGKLAL